MDFREHPELSNRGIRTAKIVACHLGSLGMEEGIGKTGFIGILKERKPGPVIGLRTNMDAFPVTEHLDVAFASKVKAHFNGQEVDVMHACGYDMRTVTLMSAATILSGMRKDLAGTVKCIFQPAEEGPLSGEEGGEPSLKKATGAEKVLPMNAIMGAEDFSFFAAKVPAVFFYLGCVQTSIKAFCLIILDYLNNHKH